MSQSEQTNKFHFIDENLNNLPTPTNKYRLSFIDTGEAGLTLLSHPSGMKTFYFYKMVGKKVYRKRIGSFPTISIEFARERVKELKTQLAKEKNHLPKEQNQLLLAIREDNRETNQLLRAIREENQELKNQIKELKSKRCNCTEGSGVNDTGIIFSSLCDKYINDYRKVNTKSWERDLKRLNTKCRHFFDKKVSDISKKDILDLFNEITVKSGKFAANRFIALLKALFNFGIACEYINVNPAKGIKKHRAEARERYITNEEMPKFLEAVKASNSQLIKDFILIALHTGQRKSNVCAMKWSDISFNNCTWEIKGQKNDLIKNEGTKNKKSNVIPLPKEVMSILERRRGGITEDTPWVFPSKNSQSGYLNDPSKEWAKIIKRAGLKDLRIHDLRRTAGSWMAINGASQYIIGKMLGHKNQASTAIYARLSHEPVKQAISEVSNSIALCGGGSHAGYIL